MVSVKENYRPDELHAPMLMGLLFRELAETFAADRWPLRQSQLRVLASVPSGGISITDLSRRVGMTKQGGGQFVGALVDDGYLRVDTDPHDARVRIVRRTEAAERAVAAATDRIRRLEQDWAERVGESRYRTFRAVLEELVLGRPV